MGVASTQSIAMGQWSQCLALAKQAAELAAKRLVTECAAGKVVRCDTDKDIKLEADFALDRILVQSLSAHSAWPIVSEERVETVGAISPNGYRWIIDPLDGSLNFARGIPFAAISIALWQGMTPLVGVVHDVSRAEVFSGIVGEGAWLNEQPIHVSQVRAQRHAVLCAGFPVREDFSTESLQAVVTGIQQYKKVRWLGSAALSLAYVACGRADVYQERQIALWDVAAGVAIVQAAGGIVHLQAAPEGQAFLVTAGNPVLVEEAPRGCATTHER